MNSFCRYGIQKIPIGATGEILECQKEENKGNHCRFSKWCEKKKEYVLSSDKNGLPCRYYEPSF